MSVAAKPRRSGSYLEHTAVTTTTPVERAGTPASDLFEWLSREYELLTDGLSRPYSLAEQRTTAPPSSRSQRLQHYKQSSGLTWEQVARLFGVSKRAVLLWRAGGTMSAYHEERLAELAGQLAEFDTGDASTTRASLFAVQEGVAPYQRWLEQVRRPVSQRAWIDRQPEA